MSAVIEKVEYADNSIVSAVPLENSIHGSEINHHAYVCSCRVIIGQVDPHGSQPFKYCNSLHFLKLAILLSFTDLLYK